MNPTHLPTDVLIIGAGFGGTACAKKLERLLPRELTITLLSSENHFVFQPLLPEVVGASLAPSHVISPLRHLLRRTSIFRSEVEQLHAADAQGLRTVVAVDHETGCRRTYRARHVVLAPGSVVDVGRIPGMGEHAMQMRNVADALALREQVIRRLESASTSEDPEERDALLTFVVVGGGFSGVETAAEINDLLRDARRYFPQLEAAKPRVVCVHARDTLLPELPARLGQHAYETLSRRGVEFLLETRTKSASGRGVYLADGRFVAARTIVCTVGNAPHPLTRALATADDGRIATDEFLRVPDEDGLWAIGDCARVPDGYGATCPPTAQFATRQGTVAAQNIAAAIAGREPRPFRHRSLGQMATLGHRRAVASIGRLRFTGIFAWWLWRTVYLMKLPRFERKLRVVLDWTLSLLFPRDLNMLSLQRTTGPAKVHLEAGETLFRQGDPSSAFFVVERGRIQLERTAADGELVTRDLLTEGEHFGEGSLLRAGTRTTTATALESSTVLVFPAESFQQLTRHFTRLRGMLESTSSRFQPVQGILPSWIPQQRLCEPVSNYMTRDVFTVSERTPLTTALREMLDRRIHAFPIVDSSNRLVGLCTSSDLFAALRRDRALDSPLAELCTHRVRTVGVDANLGMIVEVMRRLDVKHVVVTDADRRVCGIVSLRDVLARLLPTERDTTALVS